MKKEDDTKPAAWEGAITELLEQLEAEYPDPVDVFEDDLAEKLGLLRHPTLNYGNWRELRVRGIEAATSECANESRGQSGG